MSAPLSDDVLHDLPIVTVAVPMLNEMGSIESCLDDFSKQDYPLDRLDLLVIDGGSTDGSREYVERRAKTDTWIRVIDNPVGSAAAAFNLGANEAHGDVVCLFSSHGVPASDYVSRSVKVLQETAASGVGGRYLHVGTTPESTAIGQAMVSRFGMASGHRFAIERCEVDTISHPAYLRTALIDIGGFDESLARNSDYEINIRLRRAGHVLMFDPSIESIYRPRPDLSSLGRQFWHYGRWKARVARQHPRDVRLRHLVAPALVVGIAVSPVVAVTSIGRLFVRTGFVAYLVGCVSATAAARRSSPAPISTPTLAAAFPTMHIAWGGGFVASLIEDLRKK